MRFEEWAFVFPDRYEYVSTMTGRQATEVCSTIADDFAARWENNTIIYSKSDEPKYLGVEAERGAVAWLKTSIIHDGEPLWGCFVQSNRDGVQKWFCDRFVRDSAFVDEILSCLYFHFGDIIFDDVSAGNQFLRDVADKAQPEKWRYDNYSSSIEYPILKSYIEHTYYRLKEEKKILHSQRGSSVLFNLGLLERQFLRDICVEADLKSLRLAEDVEIQVLEKPRLVFEGDTRFRNYGSTPELAVYFTSMDEVVFNPDLEINLRWEHIFLERADRMPKEVIGDNQEKLAETVQKFRGNEKILRKLARRNYKMVVPQCYNGQIQFLFPVYLGTTFEGTPDFALVLALDRKSDPPAYVATTALTVEMAYQNARLLAKPETPWLIGSLAD